MSSTLTITGLEHRRTLSVEDAPVDLPKLRFDSELARHVAALAGSVVQEATRQLRQRP